MTPPPQDPPQTVLDLLLTPEEDGPGAVVPGLLSPGATGDLGRVLENVPATLREAAIRETTNAARGLLDVDLTGFLVSGWQKHREVIAAARRTVAAPGSIELVDLATHQITATWHAAVNLLVDKPARGLHRARPVRGVRHQSPGSRYQRRTARRRALRPLRRHGHPGRPGHQGHQQAGSPRAARHHPAWTGNRPAGRSRSLGRSGRRDIAGVSGLTHLGAAGIASTMPSLRKRGEASGTTRPARAES